MLKAIPYLLFDGNCAEAMVFYHACLGGELTMSRLGDTDLKNMFPPQKYDRIINANLMSGLVEISASDWMASPALEPVQGNTSAIFLVGDAIEEMRPVFDKLKIGAKSEGFQDLHELPFGMYGQFFDKFGIQWIFKSNPA